nr:unnamed protein product [Digitaria exilis]
MAGGGRVRSEWNLALLEDVVAPAYGHLLAAIAEELGVEPWSSMARELYSLDFMFCIQRLEVATGSQQGKLFFQISVFRRQWSWQRFSLRLVYPWCLYPNQ